MTPSGHVVVILTVEGQLSGAESRELQDRSGSLVAVQLRELEACQLSPNLMVPTR